jgi:hypothetical protein
MRTGQESEPESASVRSRSMKPDPSLSGFQPLLRRFGQSEVRVGSLIYLRSGSGAAGRRGDLGLGFGHHAQGFVVSGWVLAGLAP